MTRTMLLLVGLWSLMGTGWATDTEERYCLESPGLFWDVRLRAQTWNEWGGPQGPFDVYGHVHDLALEEDNPCYTRFLQGSGRVLNATEEEPAVADFTIIVHDPLCHELIARIRGPLNTDPIVYTGYVRSRLKVNGVSATLIPCNDHP